ncbi:MAG TPA: adenylyltransferase/cytidyltransferase family protein [Gemmatimonadales bacterium]|nr:adenylyltransferase/cytidyltransferase family protein [Gemmatimonadales bacterium]
MNTAAKVHDRDAAVAWRAAQRGPVVFTNGVFDLLHVGHVALLEAARNEGAALIVAVNSDGSARRLGKGPERPLVPAGERMRVVAALACVDAVVPFDDDTPLALVRALRPDVLVKGADYPRASIIGGDEVESWGGRVVRIPLVPGWSSTSLADRLGGGTRPRGVGDGA